MNTHIVSSQQHDNQSIIVPPDATGNTKHRLAHFADWLNTTSQRWFNPDLEGYALYLQSDERTIQRGTDENGDPRYVSSALSARSASAHLSTIRGRYNKLLTSNATRDRLYSLAPPEADGVSRKAFVDEILTRLQNAVDPKATKDAVKVIKVQDKLDSDHVRLTKAQGNALLNAPLQKADNTPLQTLRDTAMLALMLCTGIREAELCALKVEDLRQTSGGELSLHIRKGKGAKARVVPYGDLVWALAITDQWLQAAGIESGYVFRGFWRGGNTLRPTKLTNNAVNAILDQYPIVINGETRRVKPHDCRRTYARRLWEAGVDLVVIQQNLGHADTKTTLGYIGVLNMDQRRPPAIYDQPDLTSLKTVFDAA